MHFIDSFPGLGRTNQADPGFPLDERQCPDFKLLVNEVMAAASWRNWSVIFQDSR